ncbi:MAG: cupin domain-containing protein [Fimbriimonadaceae bacterium]
MDQAVSLGDKLALFSERWSPRVVAEMNDYQFKLVKLKGEFVWHSHEDTDETFFVVSGEMRIELRDQVIEMREGDLFVVGKGVDHRPVADEECHVLLIEPRGVVNTGGVGGELTAANDVWI